MALFSQIGAHTVYAQSGEISVNKVFNNNLVEKLEQYFATYQELVLLKDANQPVVAQSSSLGDKVFELRDLADHESRSDCNSSIQQNSKIKDVINFADAFFKNPNKTNLSNYAASFKGCNEADITSKNEYYSTFVKVCDQLISSVEAVQTKATFSSPILVESMEEEKSEITEAIAAFYTYLQVQDFLDDALSEKRKIIQRLRTEQNLLPAPNYEAKIILENNKENENEIKCFEHRVF